MTTAQSIELFTAINIGVIGLSHFLQPKIWVDFFVFLHAKKNVGNIVNALIALAMGSLILSFHFIWTWPKVLITAYGLSQLLKGLVYLIQPAIGLASIGKVTMEEANKFRWVGLVMVIFSLVIIYGLIMEGAF